MDMTNAENLENQKVPSNLSLLNNRSNMIEKSNNKLSEYDNNNKKIDVSIEVNFLLEKQKVCFCLQKIFVIEFQNFKKN